MKKTLISFILITTMLLLHTSVMYSQENTNTTENLSLTLDEAVEYAFENSSRIARVNLGLENARLIRSQARSAVRKLDDMRDNPKYIEMGRTPTTIDVRNAELQEKAAELAIEETILRIELEKERLAENVTQAYYGAILAKENLNIQKDYLNNIEEQYAIAKLKADIGTGSKSELLFAESALEEAKVDLKNAENALKQSKLLLKNLMGMDLDKELSITTNFTKLTFEIEDLDAAIEEAYKTRLDMINATNQYELAKEDFDITARKYPSNTYVHRLEKNNVIMVELNFEDTKTSVAFDIKNAHLAVENAERNILKFQQNIERAEEILRIEQVSYEASMNTLLDVNTANNQLLSAQLGLSRALHDFNIAVMEFERAITLGEPSM
ncbi:MAG: TolC family protein [Clostridiaceae bacterium]|nr:TolC family protein [Clostridiaceae bacterium]